MLNFFNRHRKFKIFFISVVALLVIIIVVPYLIPLSDNQEAVNPDTLITGNGKFLNIEGVRIYVEDQGTTTLPEAIVFLHGFGGSTFSWRYNIPFFVAQGYRVVAVDMKGFGLSDKDFSSDYSHLAQAEIVANILDKLGISRVYIVGHSMGTSVMLYFTHLYPQKVIGLVSVDGALNIDKISPFPSALVSFGPVHRAIRVALSYYLTKDRIGAILESAYYNKEIVTTEVINNYYYRAVSHDWTQSLLAMTRDMPKNVIDFPLESILSPTLILWGENDTWVTWANIDKWRHKIPDSKFYTIPEVGHMLMEEKPDVFNEIVLGFLESLKS
jgi:pimeloyl-ACP methyl ester carboxylesterase